VTTLSTARELFLRSFRWTDGHADFASAFRDPALLRVIGPALAAPFAGSDVAAVVGIEARGFVVAGLVARELDVGLVLARRPGGVHPGSDQEVAQAPDWRGRHVELRVSRDVIQPGDRLLLADDWIETGSQARTGARLLERMGAHLAGVTVLVDDTSEEVRRELQVVGLVRSDDLPPSRS
jgi:adenine phosphoribosyltransferase